MASKRNLVLMIFLLMFALSACSQSPAKKALKELKQRNIAYTEESFIEHVKSRQGDKAVVDLFLTAGMSPDAKSKEGVSALTFAARGGHTEIVALLFAKGADVNAKDNQGWTALIEAALLGNTSVAEILIDKGADVNAKNNTNQTALMIAKKRTFLDIVYILEKAGATIPKESIDGLLTVADSQWQKGDYQKALQNYQEILLLDPNNSTAKEFLKKYSAVELTHIEAQTKFSKLWRADEFRREKQEKEKKEFLARKETYYELTDDFAISEYDFKKQRFTVTVGSKTGEKVGEAIPVSYALLIVNKNGGAIELFLNMSESNATSFRKIKKKLLIIYKLITVEEYTYFDPLLAQIIRETRNNRFDVAEAAYINSVRRYIKPLYIALLTGNEKYVLYEAKESEIKPEATSKIKPIEKRSRRK